MRYDAHVRFIVGTNSCQYSGWFGVAIMHEVEKQRWTIDKSGDQPNRLVTNLLDLSHLEVGVAGPHKE